VQEQRTHEKKVAASGDADDLLHSSTPAFDVGFRDPTHAMRTRYHTQGTVTGTARINMEAHREHALKDRHWRLNVRDPSLGSPRPEAGHVSAFLYGDREILMPRHFPVGT